MSLVSSISPSPISPVDQGVKMATIELGGILYDVSLVVEDENGTSMPVTFDAGAMAKAEEYLKTLLQSHQARAVKDHLSQAPVVEVNRSGVSKTDNSKSDHQFSIAPYAPDIASNIAPKISTSAHPIDASSIKAQDVWNAFEQTLLAGSTQKKQTSLPSTSDPRKQSNPPQDAHSLRDSRTPPRADEVKDKTTPVDVSQERDTDHPLNSSRPTPPLSSSQAKPVKLFTEQVLGTIDTSKPSWYQSIPEYTRLHTYRNIARGQMGPVEQQVHKRFFETLNIYGNPYGEEAVLREIIKKLEERCALKVKPDQKALFNQAEEIFKMHAAKPVIRRQLLEKMDLFPKDSLFYQFIQEQALLDGEEIESSDLTWAEAHCLENPERFVQALQRWAEATLFSAE